MVGTRKTPTGNTTVTIDGTPVIEAVDDGDDTADITDQFSVRLLLAPLFLPVDLSGNAQFYTALLGRRLR